MSTIINTDAITQNLLFGTIFGQDWIIPIVITFAIILIINRKPQNIALLFLPVITALISLGFNIGSTMQIILLSFGSVAFIIQQLSIQTMGEAITTITGKIQEQAFDRFATRKNRAVDTARIQDYWKKREEEKEERIAEQIKNRIGNIPKQKNEITKYLQSIQIPTPTAKSINLEKERNIERAEEMMEQFRKRPDLKVKIPRKKRYTIKLKNG